MGANCGLFSDVLVAVAYITAKVSHVLKQVQLVNFSTAETLITIVSVTAYLLSSLKEILTSFDTGSSFVWENEKFDFNLNLKFVRNAQVISLQSIQPC